MEATFGQNCTIITIPQTNAISGPIELTEQNFQTTCGITQFLYNRFTFFKSVYVQLQTTKNGLNKKMNS